jgi:hypothetical protein
MDFVSSVVWDFKITRKHNFSETGPVFVFSFGEEDTYSVGSLRKS